MNVTADVTWNLGGASLFGAIYYSNSETKWSSRSLVTGPGSGNRTVSGTTNLLGLLVQGSFYLSDKWELYGRYQYIDPLTIPSTTPLSNTSLLPDISSLNAFTAEVHW